MLLTKRELPILVFNAIYIPVFTWIALSRANYEFMLYVAVILVVAGLILWKQRAIQFDRTILWGLSVWGLMHMAGGNLHVASDGGVLYSVILLPMFEKYDILRYDQLVHFVGFGVATLVCHHLLKPYLRPNFCAEPRALARAVPQESTTQNFRDDGNHDEQIRPPLRALVFLIIMMGAGLGSLNEIVEFIAVVTMPETGVGGYQNTLLDLVFNLLGASTAAVWLWRTNQLGVMGSEQNESATMFSER